MIVEEGRLLARVRHPHVVTVYGAERIERRVGLWMELVEGRTLEQLLGDGRMFTPTEVAAIGIQVSSAAAAVHAAGMLHRDITAKAQNVVLADDGRAVAHGLRDGTRPRTSALTPSSTPRSGTTTRSWRPTNGSRRSSRTASCSPRDSQS